MRTMMTPNHVSGFVRNDYWDSESGHYEDPQ